jgi:hypothetical protein
MRTTRTSSMGPIIRNTTAGNNSVVKRPMYKRQKNHSMCHITDVTLEATTDEPIYVSNPDDMKIRANNSMIMNSSVLMNKKDRLNTSVCNENDKKSYRKINTLSRNANNNSSLADADLFTSRMNRKHNIRNINRSMCDNREIIKEVFEPTKTVIKKDTIKKDSVLGKGGLTSRLGSGLNNNGDGKLNNEKILNNLFKPRLDKFLNREKENKTKENNSTIVKKDTIGGKISDHKDSLKDNLNKNITNRASKELTKPIGGRIKENTDSNKVTYQSKNSNKSEKPLESSRKVENSKVNESILKKPNDKNKPQESIKKPETNKPGNNKINNNPIPSNKPGIHPPKSSLKGDSAKSEIISKQIELSKNKLKDLNSNNSSNNNNSRSNNTSNCNSNNREPIIETKKVEIVKTYKKEFSFQGMGLSNEETGRVDPDILIDYNNNQSKHVSFIDADVSSLKSNHIKDDINISEKHNSNIAYSDIDKRDSVKSQYNCDSEKSKQHGSLKDIEFNNENVQADETTGTANKIYTFNSTIFNRGSSSEIELKLNKAESVKENLTNKEVVNVETQKQNFKSENHSNNIDLNNNKYDIFSDDEEGKILLILDDKSFQVYDEYLLKMQKMADETKTIENNMRGFSNQIQNMLHNNIASS